MSEFQPARPRYTLPFAGKDYELLGSMELIEAVEYGLKKGVGQIAVEAVNGMPSYEFAKLLSALLSSCGSPMTPKEAGDLLWDSVGIAGPQNDALRLHVYAFLSICLAPPEIREKKAKEMGELLGKLKSMTASRGKTTKKSASAS